MRHIPNIILLLLLCSRLFSQVDSSASDSWTVPGTKYSLIANLDSTLVHQRAKLARADNRLQQASALFKIANLLYKKGALDYSLDTARLALEYYQLAGEKKVDEQLKIYQLCINNALSLSNNSMANEQLTKAMELASAYDRALDYALLQNKQAYGSLLNGDLHQSINLTVETILEGQKNAWDNVLAGAYNNMGLIYSAAGQYAKAINYFTSADSLVSNIGEKELRLDIRLNMANSYLLNKDSDQAKNILSNLLEGEGAEFAALMDIQRIYFGLSELSRQTGARASMINYYKAGKNLHELSPNNYTAIQSLPIAIELMIEADNYETALAQLANFDSVQNIFSSTIVNAQQAKVYSLKGEYELAYDHKEQWLELSDSIQNTVQQALIQAERELFQGNIKQEEAQFELDYILLSKKTVFSKRLTYVLGACLLLALVFVFLIRDRKAIISVSSDQEDALEQVQLQQAEQEKEIMTTVLERKKRELATYTLQMVQQQQFLAKIKEQVTALQTEDELSLKKQLEKLKRKIASSTNQQQDWEVFRLRFENTRPAFFKSLRAHYPDLSSTEIKLCALILLDYSSREIANLLYINHSSVNTARYRIRKKMHLDANEDLKEALLKLDA